MTTKKQHKAIATLKLAISVHDLIGLANLVVAAMSGNAWFKAPSPTLATVSADITALETAQTAASTKAKGTAAVRDQKRAALQQDLRHLKVYVQLVADADPANAEAIILSAGMGVRKLASHAKQDIVAKQGSVSGTAHIVAKAVAPRASYDWQWSTDGKTWTQLPQTLQAHTLVPGLPPATTVYFRSRAVTKAGVGDWGVPTTLVVK